MASETLPHPAVKIIGMDTIIDDSLTDEEQALVDAYDEEEMLMSAGLPHLNLMVRIYQGLRVHFEGRDDVFVCADLAWFDQHGQAMAPDIAVVFGLHQHDVQSYRQDKGMPPASVVIELVSPRDTPQRNRAKIERWSSAGAGEFWLLDPGTGQVSAFTPFDGVLRFNPELGVSSPLLGGIHFGTEPDGTIVPYFPDGTAFPEDLVCITKDLRATHAALQAAHAEAESAGRRADALEAQLRALGIEPVAPR